MSVQSGVTGNDGRIWVKLVPGPDAEAPIARAQGANSNASAAFAIEFVIQHGAGPRMGTRITLEPGDGEVRVELTESMLRMY